MNMKTGGVSIEFYQTTAAPRLPRGCGPISIVHITTARQIKVGFMEATQTTDPRRWSYILTVTAN